MKKTKFNLTVIFILFSFTPKLVTTKITKETKEQNEIWKSKIPKEVRCFCGKRISGKSENSLNLLKNFNENQMMKLISEMKDRYNLLVRDTESIFPEIESFSTGSFQANSIQFIRFKANFDFLTLFIYYRKTKTNIQFLFTLKPHNNDPFSIITNKFTSLSFSSGLFYSYLYPSFEDMIGSLKLTSGFYEERVSLSHSNSFESEFCVNFYIFLNKISGVWMKKNKILKNQTEEFIINDQIFTKKIKQFKNGVEFQNLRNMISSINIRKKNEICLKGKTFTFLSLVPSSDNIQKKQLTNIHNQNITFSVNKKKEQSTNNHKNYVPSLLHKKNKQLTKNHHENIFFQEKTKNELFALPQKSKINDLRNSDDQIEKAQNEIELRHNQNELIDNVDNEKQSEFIDNEKEIESSNNQNELIDKETENEFIDNENEIQLLNNQNELINKETASEFINNEIEKENRLITNEKKSELIDIETENGLKTNENPILILLNEEENKKISINSNLQNNKLEKMVNEQIQSHLKEIKKESRNIPNDAFEEKKSIFDPKNEIINENSIDPDQSKEKNNEMNLDEDNQELQESLYDNLLKEEDKIYKITIYNKLKENCTVLIETFKNMKGDGLTNIHNKSIYNAILVFNLKDIKSTPKMIELEEISDIGSINLEAYSKEDLEDEITVKGDVIKSRSEIRIDLEEKINSILSHNVLRGIYDNKFIKNLSYKTNNLNPQKILSWHHKISIFANHYKKDKKKDLKIDQHFKAYMGSFGNKNIKTQEKTRLLNNLQDAINKYDSKIQDTNKMKNVSEMNSEDFLAFLLRHRKQFLRKYRFIFDFFDFLINNDTEVEEILSQYSLFRKRKFAKAKNEDQLKEFKEDLEEDLQIIIYNDLSMDIRWDFFHNSIKKMLSGYNYNMELLYKQEFHTEFINSMHNHESVTLEKFSNSPIFGDEVQSYVLPDCNPNSPNNAVTWEEINIVGEILII